MPGKRIKLLLFIAPLVLLLCIVLRQWLWLRHLTRFDWSRTLSGELLDLHVEPGTQNIYLLALDSAAYPYNTRQYLLYKLDGNGSVQWSTPFRQLPASEFSAADGNAWIEDVDGSVIVANNSGERFAISADGSLDWAADRYSLAAAPSAPAGSPVGAVISGDELIAYDLQGRASWRCPLPQYPNLASRELYPAADGGWLVYSAYEPHKMGEPGWDPDVYILNAGLSLDAAGGTLGDAELLCKLADYDRAVNHRFGNGSILSMQGYGPQSSYGYGTSTILGEAPRFRYGVGADPLQDFPQQEFAPGTLRRVQFEEDCAWVLSSGLWRLDQDGDIEQRLSEACAGFRWDSDNGMVSAEWVHSPALLLPVAGFRPVGDTLELRRRDGNAGGRNMIRVPGADFAGRILRVDGNQELFALASQDGISATQFKLHGRRLR
ncbi:MAG: hypothetical protein R3F46_04605 [bacterium]